MASFNFTYPEKNSLAQEAKEKEDKILAQYNAQKNTKENPYNQEPYEVTVYRVFPSDGVNSNQRKSLRQKARDLAIALGIDKYDLIINETNGKINYIEIDDIYYKFMAGGKRRKTQHKKSLKRKNKKTKSSRK